MLVVIGISFNLIIIRVGQGRAVGGTYDTPTVDAAANTVVRFAEPPIELDSHDVKDQFQPSGLSEDVETTDKVITATAL